jgi:hypothetical protein
LADVSPYTDISHLKAMAYMGGSVYYDPASPGDSPVVKGATIAIRLGHVDRTIVDDQHAYFKDKPEEAVFGKLEVLEPGKDSISVSYNLYATNGKFVASGIRDIALNGTVDLDGDALPDLSYQKPTPNRPGLESALYLSFLSSKEDLNTSMFSLIPEQYARGLYPNGVMGINPNGKFIVSKYQGQSSGRSLTKGVVYGDYVQDNQTGKYEKVVCWSSGSSARSLTDSNLETMENLPPVSYSFQVQEFSSSMTAQALLVAIPIQVRNGGAEGLGEDASVESLNALLARSDLISAFTNVQQGPIPSESLGEVLASIPSMTQDQLILLNRLYIEKSYPDICPVVAISDNPLSEIFPLLSCLIQNPEVDVETDAINASAESRAASRAVSNADYDAQRDKIEKKWAKYKKIVDLTDPKVIKSIKAFFSSGNGESGNGSTSTGGSGSSGSSASSGDAPKFKPFQKFIITTADFLFKIPYTKPEDVAASPLIKMAETDSNGKLKDYSQLSGTTDSLYGSLAIKLGLYGYFTCTWGNVEGGAGIATFLQADTNIRASASFANKSFFDFSQNLISENIAFIECPITIGVVMVKLNLNGGISLPVHFDASAEMSSGLRMAFTGLYGAEARAGVNYGIRSVVSKII